jgi:hypothetical protein
VIEDKGARRVAKLMHGDAQSGGLLHLVDDLGAERDLWPPTWERKFRLGIISGPRVDKPLLASQRESPLGEKESTA